jgi:hypothetical protein
MQRGHNKSFPSKSCSFIAYSPERRLEFITIAIGYVRVVRQSKNHLKAIAALAVIGGAVERNDLQAANFCKMNVKCCIAIFIQLRMQSFSSSSRIAPEILTIAERYAHKFSIF